MPETRNQFVEALSAHDGRGLRAAFERANQRAEQALHRTTLTRWLDGSVPAATNGPFIRLLAEELEDDNLLTAWESARGGRAAASSYRTVVNRFESLDRDDRRQAYAEIRRAHLALEYPQLMDRLSYRVEINDPPPGETDHLVVRLTQEYDSLLPSNATVRYCTTAAELGDAYEDPNCIYRELLPFEPERLAEMLTGKPSPILAYNELDEDDSPQTMVIPEGQWIGDGTYQFGNDSVARARVRTSIEHPLPAGTQQFFIQFGQTRVVGGAEFTLALNAHGATAPGVFPFLPAGRQRNWAANLLRPNELVASLGAGGQILASGDGLVLTWLRQK